MNGSNGLLLIHSDKGITYKLLGSFVAQLCMKSSRQIYRHWHKIMR